MPKLRVHNYSISLDGYGAGAGQDLEHPLGRGGERLHRWILPTRTGQAMFDGGDADHGGETGIDDDFASRNNVGIGATIIGRNMFGPVRGSWDSAPEWKGWWGPNPPYRHDTFVLTHYPRQSLEMEGGTAFHFVQDDIATVLKRAFEAADGQDVQLGGGASTIRQFLRAGLVDELHLAVVPVLLGRGERLFDGLPDLPELYRVAETVTTPAATHVTLVRAGADIPA